MNAHIKHITQAPQFTSLANLHVNEFEFDWFLGSEVEGKKSVFRLISKTFLYASSNHKAC